eukprot:871717-Prorocentrum_minimum.AAC.1
MRRLGGHKKVITATPRQLESMIRLSEALARMRLSESVEVYDVKEALRLMKNAMKQSMTDPNTGLIDMDSIFTGKTSQARSQLRQLAEAILDKLSNNGVSPSPAEISLNRRKLPCPSTGGWSVSPRWAAGVPGEPRNHSARYGLRIL